MGRLRASSPAFARVPWSLTEATAFSVVHGGHFPQSFIEQLYCTAREIVYNSQPASDIYPHSSCLDGRITAHCRPPAPSHVEIPLAANITVRVYIFTTEVSKGPSKEPNFREENSCCRPGGQRIDYEENTTASMGSQQWSNIILSLDRVLGDDMTIKYASCRKERQQ